MKVSACLVTRGDVDMQPIIDSLDFADEVLVWDNSKRENLMAYGRYELTREAKHDVIYVQDDDCIVECHQELLAAYQGGKVVVNFHREVPWVGWGALFRKDLPVMPHDRYLIRFPKDAHFLNFCDVIFTMQTPLIVMRGAYRDLPQANAENRTSLQPGYYSHARPLALERIKCLQSP